MKINNPLNQEQLKQGDLLPAGIYDFEVVNADDRISSKGNEMIALMLSVYAPNGKTYNVFDYLLESLEYKLGHFCEATGLLDKYQQGHFSSSDCVGRSGKCKIYIQQDKSGQYPDKNSVADYLPPDERKSQSSKTLPPSTNQDGFDDDIPF